MVDVILIRARRTTNVIPRNSARRWDARMRKEPAFAARSCAERRPSHPAGATASRTSTIVCVARRALRRRFRTSATRPRWRAVGPRKRRVPTEAIAPSCCRRGRSPPAPPMRPAPAGFCQPIAGRPRRAIAGCRVDRPRRASTPAPRYARAFRTGEHPDAREAVCASSIRAFQQTLDAFLPPVEPTKRFFA